MPAGLQLDRKMIPISETILTIFLSFSHLFFRYPQFIALFPPLTDSVAIQKSYKAYLNLSQLRPVKDGRPPFSLVLLRDYFLLKGVFFLPVLAHGANFVICKLIY